MLFTELKDYVVFDLEMNGSNQIIEVGALKITTGKDIEKFSAIVNNPPKGSGMASFKFISQSMGGKHGWITLDMIHNGLSEERALSRFMKFVGEYPIVGHAIVDGDVQLVKEGLRYHDLGKWHTNGKIFDTQQLHGALNGNPNDISLSGLAATYDVEIGKQKHRALADAKATLAVFSAMQRTWR
ncbi:3'-5' exonuclease [Weissella cibaria]|uniref:3'-5' exonuclease n=1 Tax=Weissella cibaria TaxID=137591 RepID=UPI00106E4DB5|nr:3'-5' exonuclease [Weissella cibaria]